MAAFHIEGFCQPGKRATVARCKNAIPARIEVRSVCESIGKPGERQKPPQREPPRREAGNGAGRARRHKNQVQVQQTHARRGMSRFGLTQTRKEVSLYKGNPCSIRARRMVFLFYNTGKFYHAHFIRARGVVRLVRFFGAKNSVFCCCVHADRQNSLHKVRFKRIHEVWMRPRTHGMTPKATGASGSAASILGTRP